MCYNKGVMGKCIRNIFLSVMVAIFGTVALSGPVFATPENPTNPETTVTTPENPETPETTESTEGTTKTEKDKTQTNSESVSCYDQVGGLGWIICPGAGLSGNIIDGAYNLLTNLIQVDPLPTETDTPTFIVWDYFKSITNILFIIFFLVVIFSQLTGIGINNYGIKKILPRLILTAILVNLSYIICTLAVDVSNILGNGFQSFFRNIQDVAIANGNISSDMGGISVSGIISAALGIGTAGTVVAALAFGGGLGGIIWFLLPILLAGVIAVISALVTMAARQAFIFLLVMISPLAFIAYMLPNTEKWFERWYKALAQMLFFYPMFSILYGASQLAGLVIITTAVQKESWIGVVLGIAVKILPLFLSIPLMRMSNSVLGKISGIIGRVAAPAQRSFGGYATEERARKRSQQLSNPNPRFFHNRLAQRIDQRRAKRLADTKENAARIADRNDTYVKQSWYRRNGNLSKSGINHYSYLAEQLNNTAIRQNIDNDFEEGFKHELGSDGKPIDRRIRKKDIAKVQRINTVFERAIVDDAIASSRKNAISVENAKRRADTIRKGIDDQSSDIHRRVLEAFNLDQTEQNRITTKKETYDAVIKKFESGEALTAEEQNIKVSGALTKAEADLYSLGRVGRNAVLSNAISEKRIADAATRKTYLELFNDAEAGPKNKHELEHAFQTGDYNAASAALEVMYNRGDKDDIGEVLSKYSDKIYGEENIRFQKEINDICLSFKAEDLDVAQWAKANMMRRGMNGKGVDIAAYIDYKSWFEGKTIAGDNSDKHVKKTSRVELYNALSSWDAVASADRTMWNQMLDMMKDGSIPRDANGKENLATLPIKYLRSAVCSGKMDGERLESFNKFFTGGYDKNGSASDNAFFFAHKDSYAENILKFVGEMTAPQLATLKTATITKLNEAMIAIDGVGEGKSVEINGNTMNKRLMDALKGQIKILNTEHSMASQRTGMNPAVRSMLGVKDEIK